MIKARAYTDDRVFEVEFDATKWFEQASDEAITGLVEIGWGGNYASDYVAQHMGDHSEELRKMFEYLGLIQDRPVKKDQCGFECYVDSHSAVKWLKAHRPNLAARVSGEKTVMCKFCYKEALAETAHLHDGQWVGDECCWDERLRSSE
jgi:hypothetical protein